MAGRTPSERRKTKTRQDILDATYALILEHGVQGLSIRAIADDIDYSPAALYRYFGSKDELVDAVRAQCFERLNAALRDAMENATGAFEQILAAGMTYIEYARQHPTDYHLMFHLPPSAATQTENQQVAMSGLLYLVRYGIETGVFVTSENYTEDTIMFHCWATVHGLAMLQTTVMQDNEARIRASSEAILRKVIAGFTAAG